MSAGDVVLGVVFALGFLSGAVWSYAITARILREIDDEVCLPCSTRPCEHLPYRRDRSGRGAR